MSKHHNNFNHQQKPNEDLNIETEKTKLDTSQCEEENSSNVCEECFTDKEIKVLQSQNDEYLDLAKRVQAEFDNYRKRTREVEKQAKQDGIALAVEKFLPIIDSIESAKKQLSDENFLKSLDLVNTQIMQSLESLGVCKIEAVGKEFDPNFHNAVLTGTDETKQNDEILEEYQAGFMLNGKVIRHSVVRVNKLEK